MNELALFAGAGGGILGGLLLGWRTVAAVEIEDYPRRVLLQRQADGILPRFPIWDDVCTFDGKPWRGKVDVISGGFPCQDISSAWATGRGAGINGARSGLWKEMARIIGEVRPRFAFVENSPLLVSRGLATVISDLAEMGYDARWCIVSAANCGAPHKRDRIWVVANSSGKQWDDTVQHKDGEKLQRHTAQRCEDWERLRLVPGVDTRSQPWRSVVESGLVRGAHGVADGVERLGSVGNGQVPVVAATAWRILVEDMTATVEEV